MSCRRALGFRQARATATVAIPTGCRITPLVGTVEARGGNGTVRLALSACVSVGMAGGSIHVAPRLQSRRTAAACGAARALLANMALGVTRGHSKTLILAGVGYRLELSDGLLTMYIGYSHPVQYALPEGLAASLQSPTELTISGADKQRVGEAAAHVRRHKPMEPYKGKGFRYADEMVRLRARRRSK
ncbi:50S ribosomal protein L6 [Candidatus Tremblaya princeps]|uniref:50S ribosomal protein L6 n=1 Tax=Tremblaya princeps TaxID=189385 RepID=A0A143WPA0_TREPR|nr:50S ribosomal protein L6 [Candidatus Tremblaya princeps]